MSTHKRIDVICIAAILLTVALTVFLMGGRFSGLMPAMSQSVGSAYFTVNDKNADWDTASATYIELSDGGSTIRGNGAYESDGNVYIAYAGHYVLTGTLTDGSVVIDADKSDQIWILLDDVTLYSDDDAAIRVEQAGHVFLTLADGTENVISSGAKYDEKLAASGVDGAIYSRDDLTINGTGALSVSGTYNHGIVCNDDLIIAGGRLTVDAVQDGIHANDSVRIREAVISVAAGDDGITVSNDDETAFFYMESGSVLISDCYEGIEAAAVTIEGGTVDITSTDDGINASGSGDGSFIRIAGGDITIANASGRDADGLDSNGSIYVEGGNLFVSMADGGGNCAIDYGTENGGECIINGGTVVACGGSAMAEGFDENSGQGFLMYQTTAEAGTTICLTDSAGKELLSEEIPYSFSSAVLSTPELKVGDTCTVTVGDTQEEVTIDNSSDSGFGSGGMFGGGMHGGKNRDGQSGGGRFDGKKGNRSEDIPAGSIVEPSDDSASSETQEGIGNAEASDRMEPPNGMERPDDGNMPDGMEPPDGAEMPDGTNMPYGMERPDGTSMPNGKDRTDQWGIKDMKGMREEETASGLPADALALAGVSAAVLLIGLVFAVRIRY